VFHGVVIRLTSGWIARVEGRLKAEGRRQKGSPGYLSFGGVRFQESHGLGDQRGRSVVEFVLLPALVNPREVETFSMMRQPPTFVAHELKYSALRLAGDRATIEASRPAGDAGDGGAQFVDTLTRS
jgi:hypothetical protein